MSLQTIMNTAVSGMLTAQNQLRVTSDNITNVNTPGYIRKYANLATININGEGRGVQVTGVSIAANTYVDLTDRVAQGGSAKADITYGLTSQLQALFGDPTSASNFFNQAAQVFTDLGKAATSPSNQSYRNSALATASTFFQQAQAVHGQIQGLRDQADGQIAADVSTINGYLRDINSYNVEISRARVSGGDSTASEVAQSTLMDKLSKLMNFTVTGRPNGGFNLRTSDGQLMVGDGYATLNYNASSSSAPGTVYDQIWLTQPSGTTNPVNSSISSGEIRGLLDMRDKTLVDGSQRLSEMISGMATALNMASNTGTSSPPPQSVTSQTLTQPLDQALQSFSGTFRIGVLDSAGNNQKTVTFNFPPASGVPATLPTTFTATVGGVTTTYDRANSGDFLNSLNTALAGSATASFTNGKLSINATTAGQGIAIQEDPTSPTKVTAKDGTNPSGSVYGVSNLFGFNNLVNSPVPLNYQTFLTPTSPSPFPGGQKVDFQVNDPAGGLLTKVSITTPNMAPAPTTMQDLLNTLNDPATGLGSYGAFSLDKFGAMTFSPKNSTVSTVQILNDKTSSTTGGYTLDQMFGITPGGQASRAAALNVNTNFVTNPGKLPLGQANLTVATGSNALSSGDGRAGQAMADAFKTQIAYNPTLNSQGMSSSGDRFSSLFAGTLGGQASTAKTNSDSAATLARATASRRQSMEGVNLNEELVNMTTFQQAFNASSRLIQAARDMYDTIIGMVR